MTAQIDKSLLEDLLTANQAMSNAITKILSSIKDERWVTPLQAEAELGIPSQTIRYLARSGQVASRLIGKKRMEVLLSDLQSRA
ncbi:MAG: hypothetical protein VB088_07975 [Sphaerochaeta sp.]|nr:hypothetical protein [Sphaerochaeta sp.]